MNARARSAGTFIQRHAVGSYLVTFAVLEVVLVIARGGRL